MEGGDGIAVAFYCVSFSLSSFSKPSLCMKAFQCTQLKITSLVCMRLAFVAL